MAEMSLARIIVSAVVRLEISLHYNCRCHARALKICSKLSLDGYRTSGRANWHELFSYRWRYLQDGALIPGSGQALSNVDETIATYRRTFIKGYILTCRTRTLTWIGSPSPDLVLRYSIEVCFLIGNWVLAKR